VCFFFLFFFGFYFFNVFLGNIGKSILCQYIDVYDLGNNVPAAFEDYKGLMHSLHGMSPKNLYLVDLPRALQTFKLSNLYSALETLKSGFIWDQRYGWKRTNIDCPMIWVFTNKPPPPDFLSRDRWKIWYVNEQRQLVGEDGTIATCVNVPILKPVVHVPVAIPLSDATIEAAEVSILEQNIE
jgi:hypothetical protein